MTPVDIPAVVGLTDAEISIRLSALELTAADRHQLAKSWECVNPQSEPFVRRLYARFESIPSLAALLVHESRRDRMYAKLGCYLRELFCSEVDQQYVLSRLQLGMVLHRIRVSPQWYLAACCHLLTDHIGLILASCRNVEEGIARVLALLKSVCFDASLVLDSYGRCEDSNFHLRQFDQHASSFSETRPQIPNNAFPSEPSIPRKMSRIRLSVSETHLRTDFLGLDETGMAHLRSLSSAVGEALPQVLDNFSSFFSSTPKLAEIAPPEVVKRLKLEVTAYWREFTDGKFDRPYAASRMRIGVIHEEIGLEPVWYLAGLARQVDGLVRALPHDTPQFPDVLTALFRGLFFDLTFVIDAYMEARAESLQHAEGLAGRVMAGLNSAVAVFDANHRIQFANEKLGALTGIEPALLYLMEITDAIPSLELASLLAELSPSGGGQTSCLMPWGPTHFQVTLMQIAPTEHRHHHQFAMILDDVGHLLQGPTPCRSPSRRHLRQQTPHLSE